MVTKKRRGRKTDPSSKSGKIRGLLSSGLAAAEIAKKVGCTVALVYNIKSKDAGGGTAKAKAGAKPGRKPGRKAAAPSIGGSDLGAILTAVKNAEIERLQMRAALEKISAVINDALAK
jgi:DNA invertase Pin-like site-specific DNA recombinase